MAYDFGATRVNRLTSLTTVLTAADPRPCSVGFRIKQNTTTDRSFTVNQWVFENVDGGGNPNFGVAITVPSAGNNRLSLYTNSAYTSSSNWTASTAWQSLLLTWATGAPGAVAFYRNGAQVSTTTATLGGGNVNQVSAIGALKANGSNAAVDVAADIEYDTNAGFNIDGSLGEFCIWNVVLDAAEGAAFTAGASGLLIRPASIRCYMPFNNGVIQDLYRGAAWVQQGANTKQADHPRVFLRSGPMSGLWPAPAAPAATSFYPYPPVHPGMMNILMR